MIPHLERKAAGLPIFYRVKDGETATAMAEAVEDTVRILRDRWQLPTPVSCQLYVLDGWQDFLRQSAPQFLWPLLAISKPLWASRIARVYEFAGGWMMPWGRRTTVGVKPPRLLEVADVSLGERLFIKVPSMIEKVKRVTCHELTHAFTHHLRLPPWLNEGVAMRAVDHMVRSSTVLSDTRGLISSDPRVFSPRAYRRTLKGGSDELLRLYATGYWSTRILDEGTGTELGRLLRVRRSKTELSRLAAETLERIR